MTSDQRAGDVWCGHVGCYVEGVHTHDTNTTGPSGGKWVMPEAFDMAMSQRDQARRLVKRFMKATPRQMDDVRRAAEKAMTKW